MMNKHRLRMSLLGVLCGGLMLLGVGVGVCAVEFSDFSYGGVIIPHQEEKEIRQVIRFNPKGKTQTFRFDVMRMLENSAEIVPDEQLEPGTILVEAKYRAMPQVEYSLDAWQSGETEWNYNFYQSSYTDGLSTLLAIKDQLMQDLKEHCLHSYEMSEMTEIRIHVRPENQNWVCLAGGPANTLDLYQDTVEESVEVVQELTEVELKSDIVPLSE